MSQFWIAAGICLGVVSVLIFLLRQSAKRNSNQSDVPGEDEITAAEIQSISDIHAKLETRMYEVNASENSSSDMSIQVPILNNHSGNRIQLIMDSIHDGVIATDAMGRIQQMNPAAENMTGWPLQDALGKSVEVVFDIVHPEQGNALQNPVRDVLVTGEPIETKHYVLLMARDGSRRQILTSAAPIYGQNRKIDGVVLVCHDVSELYESRQALAEREKTFRDVTNATPVMLWMMSPDRQLTFTNRACSNFLGLNGVLNGVDYFARIHDSDRGRVMDAWDRIAERANSFVRLEFRMQTLNQAPVWLYTVVQAIHDPSNQLLSFVGSSLDISERKKAETQVERLAYYDSLTNLPNRRLLLDRLGRTLTAVTRDKQFGAVFYLDLDHFKTLNDSMGHSVGDQLLKQVAQRIRSTLRAEDTVARFGGDEFLVLSGQLEQNQHDAVRNARLLGEKIRLILDQPYQLGDYEYQATPSIGVTLFSHANADVEAIIKQADTAMYRAKSAGRNQVCFFESHMQDRIVAQVGMENALRRALRSGQFQLYYQPQVDVAGKLLGAEALLRWPQTDGQIMSPKSFLSVAEETGQIISIGYWILQAACEQLHIWEAGSLPDEFTLSVNISHRQFIQQDFATRFESIISKSGINPERLKIELTEYVVKDSLELAIEKMMSLKSNLNIKFSLDDFGTGFSSLTYLRRFPLDEVKIDRAFIRDLQSDQNDALLTETILDIGRKLGVKVLAEGVENTSQQDFLRAHGCERLQGFLFGKPVTAAEFDRLHLSIQKDVDSA